MQNDAMNARYSHLYQELAGRLAQAIQAGSLKAGDRLPSVRQLSAQHQVSISTVTQAYRWTPSETLYPGAKLARLLASAARRRPGLISHYGMSPGHPALRTAIARRAVEFGCALAPEDIVVTNGCTEALNLALRAVAGAGDTIALESPTYFTLLQLIESLGMKALEIPTHPRAGISLEALELATRMPGQVKAVMLIPNFSNPLGSLMPDDKKEMLVRMLEDCSIPLIEDDIYGEAYFGSARPFVAKAWDRSGNVLLCGSFTKNLAPGFRVGWIAPGRFRERVEMMKFLTSITTPELPQVAIAEFIANGGYDHHLRKLRAAFAEQVHRTAEAVGSVSRPIAASRHRKGGSYCGWNSPFGWMPSRCSGPQRRSTLCAGTRAHVHVHRPLHELHPSELRTSLVGTARSGAREGWGTGCHAGRRRTNANIVELVTEQTGCDATAMAPRVLPQTRGP